MAREWLYNDYSATLLERVSTEWTMNITLECSKFSLLKHSKAERTATRVFISITAWRQCAQMPLTCVIPVYSSNHFHHHVLLLQLALSQLVQFSCVSLYVRLTWRLKPIRRQVIMALYHGGVSMVLLWPTGSRLTVLLWASRLAINYTQLPQLNWSF